MTKINTHKINNAALEPLIKSSYQQQDLERLQQFLEQHQALEFRTTQHNLFPAAATADSDNTGYKNVWVRDNIYVAYAHYVMGDRTAAIATLSGLSTYFQTFQFRFDNIIHNPKLKEEVMQRPHIRFNGETLSEVDEDWEHAQNDALGYFLWLYCKLASEHFSSCPQLLDKAASSVLLKIAIYLNAIRYWEDSDSGHWEEGRKISASSIGPVIAGLKALNVLIVSGKINLRLHSELTLTAGLISHLIAKGESALNTILPWECRTPDNERRYDAALLYLIYPLKVVDQQQANTILADVKKALAGEYGIARYPYDSFWCKDFQDLDKSIQTAKYTGRETWLKEHNRAVKRGEEAQWCIFDPIISAIYGEWYQDSKDPKHLALQTHHFNRSLGQITGKGNIVSAGAGNNTPVDIPAYRCPELYYIQHNEYTPNVSTPLLWTQANLCIAFKLMTRNLTQGSDD